ncbi:hypothetical protein [Streptomyces sp. NPDC048438]|uniref:hypothetical protein n=1 Tax=Streptomyces sp. NPDC048438 TaxID=3365551 RepID=UPI00371954FD
MAGGSYVLDCEALSRAALGDPQMKALLKDAHRAGVRVVSSSMTLIEAYHGRIRLAEWNWAMSRIATVGLCFPLIEPSLDLTSLSLRRSQLGI